MSTSENEKTNKLQNNPTPKMVYENVSRPVVVAGIFVVSWVEEPKYPYIPTVGSRKDH